MTAFFTTHPGKTKMEVTTVQIFKRDDDDKVNEEFALREKEVYFIPQKRIESLLEEGGLLKFIGFLRPISLTIM